MYAGWVQKPPTLPSRIPDIYSEQREPATWPITRKDRSNWLDTPLRTPGFAYGRRGMKHNGRTVATCTTWWGAPIEVTWFTSPTELYRL